MDALVPRAGSYDLQDVPAAFHLVQRPDCEGFLELKWDTELERLVLSLTIHSECSRTEEPNPVQLLEKQAESRDEFLERQIPGWKDGGAV